MRHIVETIKDLTPVSLVTYTNKSGQIALGYNHIIGIHNGQECTQQEADHWLFEDVMALKLAVNKLVSSKLTKCQERAVLSLVHDISLDTFVNSKLRQYLNNNNMEMAVKCFAMYNTNGRAVNINTIRRRKIEQNIFNLEVTV